MTSAERPAAHWLGDAELRLPAGLALSFQRYARPESGVIERAPSSLGALPVGLTRDGELVLPLAPRECFWIGIDADVRHPLWLALALEREDGAPIDVLSGSVWNEGAARYVPVPGVTVIDGIRRADGAFDPLVRDDGARSGSQSCRLRIWLRRAPQDEAFTAAILHLVDYATFAASTGAAPPDPLDPDAGYKGWRLP
jgi:hypothetical protein